MLLMVIPKKILVVDADHTAFYLVQLAVKRITSEAQVQMANNEQEALQIVRTNCSQEQCPHLIFLDIQSHHRDRIDFVEQLQNAPDLKQLPVQIVLVSSCRHYLQQARSKNYPVLDYIEKPLTAKKLAKYLG